MGEDGLGIVWRKLLDEVGVVTQAESNSELILDSIVPSECILPFGGLFLMRCRKACLSGFVVIVFNGAVNEIRKDLT